MAQGHPNTLAAGFSGGAATLGVYLANQYLGTHLTATDAAGIATGITALLLFVGRRGVKGTLGALWNGSEKPKPKV